MEIITIASFINYKLCKIMFNLNVPKDAISQFRLHTDRSEIFFLEILIYILIYNKFYNKIKI